MKPRRASKKIYNQHEECCIKSTKLCEGKFVIQPGCDTPALFGQGKTAVLKFLESNSNFTRELCSVF